METQSAKLVKRVDLAPDIFELYFEPNEGTERFNFKGGQFLSLIVPKAGPGGRDLRRAYSISSSPDQPGFELCVKYVPGGPGTTYLNSLQKGDEIRFIAPYGDFVFKSAAGRDVVMIATGTGIAPFKAMVESTSFLNSKPKNTTILFGARIPVEVLYSDLFKGLLGNSGYIGTLSRSSAEEIEKTGARLGVKIISGRVTDYLRWLAQSGNFNWANTDFYLCGNGAMIDEVKSILNENGVQKGAIFQEVYYKPKPGQVHAS